MNKFLQASLILPLILLVCGCKKEGPQGPPGNANVTARTFTVTNWSWDAPYYYVDLNVPELNSSNLNSAAVLVYFSVDGGSAWIALPYTQYDSPYNYYMGFITGVNIVEVTWFYDSSLSSGSNPNTYYSTNLQFKVVVIPPAQRKANPNLDWYNYEAVKSRFNLPD